MRIVLYALPLAVALTSLVGCERQTSPNAIQAADKIAPLPNWMSQPAGSDANPIGAVAIWSRCSSSRAAFVEGLSQIGPQLARINASFPAPLPVDSEEPAEYPLIVAPLTELYRDISGVAFVSPLYRGVYEPTAEYDLRVASARSATSEALRLRLQNQKYAVVLGAYRMNGMDHVEGFQPAYPDNVRYDADSGVFTPVRNGRSGIQPLERVETFEFVRVNQETLTTRHSHYEWTRVIVENEVPLGPQPTMANGEAERRHPGLAFVVVGSVTGITPEAGGDRKLQIRAERIELRDICADEVLWHQEAGTKGASA